MNDVREIRGAAVMTDLLTLTTRLILYVPIYAARCVDLFLREDG